MRALGTRHSFTDLPDTDGTLVSIAGIEGPPVLDESARTVDVPAGIRYGELARWLHGCGWALHNLGSLPHISVAGALATGTHGSGDGNGVLATAARRIEYVSGTGELESVAAGEAEFDGLVIGLGAYGIVVRVTLAIEPTYRVRQDVYQGLRWDAALDQLDDITRAGYSVSLFTRWTDDVAIWVKTRLASDDQPVAERLAGAHRIGTKTPVESNLTPQGGVPGNWHERLPHFRLDATPSNGDEIQSEYFVDAAHAVPAVQAVRELADRIAPILFATELRTAASDSLWLSGAFERPLFAIGFTWRNEPERVLAVLPDVERVLADFSARPHWGKLHTLHREALGGVVPRLSSARAIFERLDPAGVFTNSHLERVGVREPRGEPDVIGRLAATRS